MAENKKDKDTTVETPLDAVLGTAIADVGGRGRGLVLDLAKEVDDAGGKKLVIEIKQPVPQHDEWEPRAAGRSHVMGDLSSFVDFVERYGDPDESLVLASLDQVECVIDDFIERGDREIVTLPLKRSEDWNDWMKAFQTSFTHAQLYRFLQEHERNLIDLTLLSAVSKIKATATVNADSDMTDSGETVGIVFKTTKGESLEKFPKKFAISLPVLEFDDTETSDERVEKKLTVNLIVNMPTKPMEPVTFDLKCSLAKSVERNRIKDVAQTIAGRLTDYPVLTGETSYAETEERKFPEPFKPTSFPR